MVRWRKAYRLHGPKGRRYLFVPLDFQILVREWRDATQVERWEDAILVERWEPTNGGMIHATTYPAQKARWFWKMMASKHGYSL